MITALVQLVQPHPFQMVGLSPAPPEKGSLAACPGFRHGRVTADNKDEVIHRDIRQILSYLEPHSEDAQDCEQTLS